MRYSIIIVALTSLTVASAQSRPALSPVEQQLLGSWKSPNLGLDFPIWMVDTYAADGSVLTNFYSKPRDKEILSKDKIDHHWRIKNGALEVGKIAEGGSFEIEGQPRRIKLDAAGKVTSVDGWVRVATAASQPSGGR